MCWKFIVLLMPVLTSSSAQRFASVPLHRMDNLEVKLLDSITGFKAKMGEYLRYIYSHNNDHDIIKLSDIVPHFMAFQISYNKSYATDAEASKRLEIFRNNLLIILKLQKEEKGSATYGITQFADLTVNEFLKLHTGYIKNTNSSRKPEPRIKVKNDLPVSRDWRKDGAVTPVKNQGTCGSCWAFSVTGNVEGVWKVKMGQLMSLSEQQLVDCDHVDKGCMGGEMQDAYKEVERMGGLETESEYPYKGKGRSCQFQPSEVRVYINDSVSLPQDESKMAQYLSDTGPIAVAINASPLMFYMGGVVHPWRLFCSPHHLNHGVLAVGYGVDGAKPYWLIKNSWGSKWGEQGYFRLFRGQGVCGVDKDASSVIIY